MSNEHGIDVGTSQPDIDWNAVRGSGREFVYVKATEGTGYVSPILDQQVNGARGVGMTVGLYHFARPDTNTPEDEAKAFAGELKRLDASSAGHLSPCLDVEREGGNLPRWVGAFIAALREQVNRGDVMVYASARWFESKIDPNSWATDGVNLWVAHYGAAPGQPEFQHDRVVMHQYASDGQVPGVAGRTDLDVCMTDLRALTGQDQGGSGGKSGGGWLSRLFGR